MPTASTLAIASGSKGSGFKSWTYQRSSRGLAASFAPFMPQPMTVLMPTEATIKQRSDLALYKEGRPRVPADCLWKMSGLKVTSL